jgi:ribonuclease-3
LAYVFREPQLLERALTHRSKSGQHNERLEFLGDSVLNLAVSSELYRRYSELTEGELTRLRAFLVRKPTLAEIARDLDLGQHVKLGEGELKSGGFDRESILADTMEAVFGAIYVDDAEGKAAHKTVLHLYQRKLLALDPRSIPKDPKTELQEFLQKIGHATPAYRVLETSGEAHQQYFVVECRVAPLPEPVVGRGHSRRYAEQDAAAQTLARLTKT